MRRFFLCGILGGARHAHILLWWGGGTTHLSTATLARGRKEKTNGTLILPVSQIRQGILRVSRRRQAADRRRPTWRGTMISASHTAADPLQCVPLELRWTFSSVSRLCLSFSAYVCPSRASHPQIQASTRTCVLPAHLTHRYKHRRVRVYSAHLREGIQIPSASPLLHSTWFEQTSA